MSKTKCSIMILITLMALVLISINQADRKDIQSQTINTDTPTYKSDYSNTVVYSPEGQINYHLVAKHVKYFSGEGVSWFSQPVMTAFDIDKVQTWLIKSDRVKLTNDRILYLYGHVEVNSLTPDTQLCKIVTDNAQINLVTQDVISQDLVTFYGKTFNSRGLGMRGNLRRKNAELVKAVKTSYEIKNKKVQP